MQTERRALLPGDKTQGWDEARLITVPRFKRSHASGDEWRTSQSLVFYSKGEHIYTHEFYWAPEDGTPGEVFAKHVSLERQHALRNGRGTLCDQQGCSAQATVIYRLKLQGITVDGVGNAELVDPCAGA